MADNVQFQLPTANMGIQNIAPSCDESEEKSLPSLKNLTSPGYSKLGNEQYKVKEWNILCIKEFSIHYMTSPFYS